MRAKRPEEEAFEIPLIPMIDCMLVIIIFFLVATTLKHTEKELPIELPRADASLDREVTDQLLILGVDRAGQKYLRSRPVSTEALHSELREIARANPAQHVRIDADRLTTYQDIVEVMELCQFYGLRDIGLHTRGEPK